MTLRELISWLTRLTWLQTCRLLKCNCWTKSSKRWLRTLSAMKSRLSFGIFDNLQKAKIVRWKSAVPPILTILSSEECPLSLCEKWLQDHLWRWGSEDGIQFPIGFFDVFPHLSLQMRESPCGKGFEASERAFWPPTDLSLASHSKGILAICRFYIWQGIIRR